MSIRIKYAYKKHNTWVYRRVYPKPLQPLLGSALKQSLKTGDATQAKTRVAELNQTFTSIIKEAQAHALATPHTDTPTATQTPRLAVGRPHGMLSDTQVSILLGAKDRVLHSALLFGLLTGMRSGEICGLMAEDITAKGNLGRFVSIRPNRVRLLKSKAAEREVPLHGILENLLDTALPRAGRLFPYLTVDKVVKRYAYLRRLHPELHGTVFHSTRKWFITQCERTGVPEHFTATLVGHHSARSQNKLTYGLYSAGISHEQKREIVEGVRVPER